MTPCTNTLIDSKPNADQMKSKDGQRDNSLEISIAKMWKNSIEAIECDHTGTCYISIGQCASVNKQSLAIEKHPPLQCLHFSAEGQGSRPCMEDAHFFQEISQGVVLGVCDGHGGKEVAEYASAAFCSRFSSSLQAHHGDARQAMISLIEEIHLEVCAKEEWNDCGTVAVICFVDLVHRLVYTATLGDCEANIYRKIEGQMRSIPLSCIRNWAHPKELARTGVVLEDGCKGILWKNQAEAKRMYYVTPMGCLNVSRSIGDANRNKNVSGRSSAISHKPKVTAHHLLPGDLLVLACDGLRDAISENEIVQIIETSSTDLVANRLMRSAIEMGLDNVTVLAVQFPI